MNSWRIWLKVVVFLTARSDETSCFPAFAVGFTAQTPPFTAFRFVDRICKSPAFFVDSSNGEKFKLRDVPGDGDCMFVAVALAASSHFGFAAANDEFLRTLGRRTRRLVGMTLANLDRKLLIEGDRTTSCKRMLVHAASELGIEPKEYVELLLTDGLDGGLYGGGPELTVLSNLLRRPISIYELASDQGSNPKEMLIECKGTFGKGAFDDPLEKLPESAITSMATGSMSWTLHILVLETIPGVENHAGVLLPHWE